MNNPAFISLIAMRQSCIDFRDSDALTCRRAERGFTLIELLITLSIAVILLTVAIPSFRDFLLNSRLSAQTNELVLALTLAKSEAVKRGSLVTVCSRSTNTACAGSTTWDSGWLVFVDGGVAGTVDGADVVLQVGPELTGGNTLRSGLQRVTFQNTGFSPGFGGTFRLCDARGASEAHGLIVSLQGRIRRATDSNADGTEEDGSGNNLVCP